MYLFVYGILKSRKQPVKENVTIAATMYDLGLYPAITQLGTNNQAVGNIIEVTDSEIEVFDRIEGVPSLYDRQVMKTSVGETFIYVYQQAVEDRQQINKWEDRNAR